MFPKMLSKVFIDDLKALRTLDFSDLFFLHSCTNKCIDFFSLQEIVNLWHKLLFLSVDFISGRIATNFLGLLNHKLMTSETFLEKCFPHEYRVLEILKFCTQTGSVRNRWKFLVANWTELAL